MNNTRIHYITMQFNIHDFIRPNGTEIQDFIRPNSAEIQAFKGKKKYLLSHFLLFLFLSYETQGSPS